MIPDLISQESTISLFSRLMRRYLSITAEFETRAGAKSTTSPNALYIGATGLAAHSQGTETVRLEMAGLLVQNW